MDIDNDLLNKNLLDAILANADLYHRENLNMLNRHEIQIDWWEAFDFFLGRACYQGRRDKVSDIVYERAHKALGSYFANAQKDQNYESENQQGWENLRSTLSENIGKGYVGKARDVEMIISALKFVDRLPYRNIVTYSVRKIMEGQIQQHYKELQAEESAVGITQVGPKIAAVYLRDVVSLFDLFDFVDDDSAFCLQAVDTWVQTIAERLGIVESGSDPWTTQKKIAEMCVTERISPFRFNQGAWYTGINSLDLLLKLYSKSRPC